MAKSMEITEVPLRTVVLLSDCEGVYGIGINPSAWVRSFICDEHELKLHVDEIEEDELDVDEIEEDELDLDETVSQRGSCAVRDERKTCERIEEKVDELMQGLYRPLVLRPDVIQHRQSSPTNVV